MERDMEINIQENCNMFPSIIILTVSIMYTLWR